MFAHVLSETAQAALALLGKSGLLKDAYLAGGSALALHFGHRLSVDFDFFTAKQFDPHALSRQLSAKGRFEEELAKGISLIGKFEAVKFSCFEYNYPLIATPSTFLNVTIAHPHDIAAMKLVAICDRGTKRDYIDLYMLTKQGISLDDMCIYYDKKYHKLKQNIYTLLKALIYFDEADNTEMPQILKPVSWDEVKRFFTAESLRLAKKYLE